MDEPIKLSRKVTYTGSFFTHNPGQTFRQNLATAVGRVGSEGLKFTKELTPVLTGETRDSLGLVHSRTSLNAVIRPLHPNSGSRLYPPERTMFVRATMVERRYHPFRYAATALRKAIKTIVVPELLKGIE